MADLNDYQIAAIQLVMGRGRVTTKELSEHINKGSSLCAKTLKSLAGMNILEWHGSGPHDPSQYYSLIKTE